MNLVNLNIFLDTNIFIRANYNIYSSNFLILRNYLIKSSSKLFLPKIVLDEIEHHFKNNLSEKVKKFNEAKKDIKILLPELNKYETDLNLNIENEWEKYKKKLLKLLFIKDNQILPSEGIFLEELINRSILRKKPSDGNGGQFRDTLIWLTIINFVEKSNSNCIFISENTKDFADNNTLELHDELELDLPKKANNFKYFKNLNSFNESVAKKVDLINFDWLIKIIEKDKIYSLIEEEISKNYFAEVSNYIHRKFPNLIAKSSLNLAEILIEFDTDIYIYQMDETEKLISISSRGTIELDAEVLDEDDPRLFQLDPYEIYSFSDHYSSHKIFPVEYECFLHLRIIEEDFIDEYEMSDFTFSLHKYEN